ncbi:MAG: M15 family metallopeptidase [Deltaproteobacteria bacterium]|nr:M15 family metallopeptidase [Deltaproteobacteria bacterium]
MMRLLLAFLSIAALVAPVSASADAGVHFKGLKSDPKICVGEGEDERCCGHLTAGGEVRCRGPEFLHPAMRPIASCLVDALEVTNNPDVCSSGLRETFRTSKLQASYKSVPGGYSFHNYGLAVDVCSYFKSGDCSDGNLLNKVLGGLVKWTKGGKVRCQAVYRKKGSGPSNQVAAKVKANPHFASVIKAVRSCFEDSSVPYGASNWGALWKDYFDAPHFQYLASPNAGYYKKKKALNGPHVFVRLLADCYSGDRKSLLGDLYAAPDPVAFIRSRKDGCGAAANALFDSYVEANYSTPF